jgi:guanylate kinase
MKKGKIIVISAPSGTGKTTICNALKKSGSINTRFSVSVTTRNPRKNEINGKHYFFVTVPEFKRMIKQRKFIEWAKVFHHYYGTLKQTVEQTINRGYNVMLNIDVQGGRSIKRLYPQETILVFVLPPSAAELERRLRLRNLDDEHTIQTRLNIAKREMQQIVNYEYYLINDTIKSATNKIKSIIREVH